jgi:y4mF family transcriptional regulator
MNKNANNLSKHLKQKRKQNNITQPELAMKAGVGLRFVRDLEQGKNTLRMDKVNDVWSPNQMKEAKDEIYKQKSRWVAAIAIITFVQIIIGLIISVWSKLG